MNYKYISFITAFVLLLFSYACKEKQPKDKVFYSGNFVISNLKLPENYEDREIYLDYDNAIYGFKIPSKNQTDNAFFNFSFTVKNTNETQENLYYKIYYRNESYKFPEYDDKKRSVQNKFAHENFYGSWEDTEIGFKNIGNVNPNETIHITDSFRIVGNPRNEARYFFEGNNDRWKRNPRLGDYSFLIVVTSAQELEKLPKEIVFLHKIDKNNFTTPYHYFLHGEGSNLTNSGKFLDSAFMTVKANIPLDRGIYINEWDFRHSNADNLSKHYSENCNNKNELYKEATISQFTHYIDESAKLYNIPLIKNIFEEVYTKTDYNWGRAFYRKNERIGLLPTNAEYPCKNIYYEDNRLVIKNPKSDYGNWRKQNVGMITRHGLTYGKFTVKANLTRLLNDDNVWNGITNAIWLINQGGAGLEETGWNLRRPCPTKGYMATYWGGPEDDRVERVAYSEIDFEILKTVHYCPSGVYPPVYENYYSNPSNINSWNTIHPEEILKYDNKIAVCCTNWDMACHEPKNFSTGCHEVEYNGKKFLAHRWKDTYRAVTTKYMAPDDELFNSDYYYFQIDWQPQRIIWRIGPEKDKLYTVGYVDETISMIPDNQMLLIITQEFHNTNWWPGSPYSQENIPFPKDDYTGYIYEITIE